MILVAEDHFRSQTDAFLMKKHLIPLRIDQNSIRFEVFSGHFKISHALVPTSLYNAETHRIFEP